MVSVILISYYNAEVSSFSVSAQFEWSIRWNNEGAETVRGSKDAAAVLD